MKIFKRTVCLFLAFCLCAGMLLLQPQSTVSAAVRNKPTTTVLRMSSNSFDSSAIYVNLPKAKVCYIKNIKTSSKNLIAKTPTIILPVQTIHTRIPLRLSASMPKKPVNTKSPMISAINQETNFLRVK